MNKVLRYLAAALAAFATVSAFAAEANTCKDGEGCNDPNAQKVLVPMPRIGVQKPAGVPLTTTEEVDTTVNRNLRFHQGENKVYNGLRPLCIYFDPAKPCPPSVAAPMASVVSHEPSRTIVATGSAVSASVPATGPF